MNGIVDFFYGYGFISLIVTLIATAAGVLSELLLKDKLSDGIRDIIPTVTAIIAEIIANMLFIEKAMIFNANALYAGIICGSVSTAASAFINKIIKGKVSAKDVTELISELLYGFIEGEKRAETVNAILSATKDESGERLNLLIERLIKENGVSGISESKAKEITENIIALLATLKKIN